MKFYQLGIKAVFRFRGRRFQKLAMSMAWDEKRQGTVFQGGTEVEPEGTVPLLSPEEAEKWRPPDVDWSEHLWPAPGQRGTVNR